MLQHKNCDTIITRLHIAAEDPRVDVRLINIACGALGMATARVLPEHPVAPATRYLRVRAILSQPQTPIEKPYDVVRYEVARRSVDQTSTSSVLLDRGDELLV